MDGGAGMMLGARDTERRCRTFNISYLLVIISFVLSIQGCATKVHVTYVPQQRRVLAAEAPVVANTNILQLKQHYEKWRGTPYVDGGMSPSGIDCSGFTLLAYRDLFGVSLPRTAIEQAESGREVSRAALRTGDLVFFNTGRAKKHVGIYLAEDQFVHASLSKGVTLSSLDDSYWQEKYWQARRLQAPPMNQYKQGAPVFAAYRR
ncbi:MAG: NlpC/P60 family protein [Desulforhopalus sp.]|nr:NlpC/P60 family protein [Desulforhopalus sp.]